MPDYKKGPVSSDQLALWTSHLDDADITGHVRRALIETFVAEGGFRGSRTENGQPAGTVAGLSPDALGDAGPEAGIPAGTRSADLTNQQRVQLYKAFMGQPHYLGRVGGIAALETLPDEEVAAALFDTLFMHGSGNGTGFVRDAINAVDPGRLDANNRSREEIFEAYRSLASDSKTRRQLLDALAAERAKDTTFGRSAQARYDYFRFQSSERVNVSGNGLRRPQRALG